MEVRSDVYSGVALGLLNEDQDEDEESKKKVEEKMLNVLSWPERPRKMNLKNLDSLNKEIPETKGESAPNLFYVPLMWAIDLVNKAYDEGLIKDDVALKALILVITSSFVMFSSAFALKRDLTNPNDRSCFFSVAAKLSVLTLPNFSFISAKVWNSISQSINGLLSIAALDTGLNNHSE